MHRRLLYEDDEGNLLIIISSRKFQSEGTSEHDALYQQLAEGLPDVVEFIVCLPEALPTDLTWREAWRLGNRKNPVKIDFQKCIEIHRHRLSIAASRYLSKLDEQFKDAVKRSNLPEQVAIRKTQEILKTIHQMNLTHCKTPSDLKYAIPRELHEFWDFYSPKKETDNDSLSPKDGQTPWF